MALLDASQSAARFSTYVGYYQTAAMDIANFSWDLGLGTPGFPDDRLAIAGTGFTYNGNLPNGGNATSSSFDASTDGFIDWTLTGFSIPLTSLFSPTNTTNIFWGTALGGNDTIKAPLAQGGVLFGDRPELIVPDGSFTPLSVTGGNDIFYGQSAGALAPIRAPSSVSPDALVGDVVLARGSEDTINGFPVAIQASVTGGNDTFNISSKAVFLIVGDVQWAASLSAVIGGDDIVNSTVDFVSLIDNGGGRYVGDVELNEGYVEGGNDTINGSSFGFANELLVGDVLINDPGTLIGGADRLNGRAGQEFLVGDVYTLRSGNVTGGADIIQGGDDADIIAGDVFRAGSGATPAVFTLRGGNDNLYGDAGNDWIAGDMWSLAGGGAASTLIGGNDQLYGGTGDDTLRGDFDGPMAGLTYTGGNDILDGGEGADLLDGGLGNDTYINPTGDTIIEGVNGGIDTVKSAVAFSLAGMANLERLTLTGSANINGTGNGLDNLITGNAGANILNGNTGNDTLTGGAGADTLQGAQGDDIYVDTAGDTIVELAGQGTDTVQSAVAFSLAALPNVENVTLTGSAIINATGNTAANVLTGNSAKNVLTGDAGNDTLYGGGGRDILVGGAGNDLLHGGTDADTFRFAVSGMGADRIQSFEKTLDRFDLTGRAFTAATPSGADTLLTYSGGTITVIGVTGLILAQWNALVLPAGGSTASPVTPDLWIDHGAQSHGLTAVHGDYLLP